MQKLCKSDSLFEVPYYMLFLDLCHPGLQWSRLAPLIIQKTESPENSTLHPPCTALRKSFVGPSTWGAKTGW